MCAAGYARATRRSRIMSVRFRTLVSHRRTRRAQAPRYRMLFSPVLSVSSEHRGNGSPDAKTGGEFMDISRPSQAKAKRRRQIIYGVVGLIVIAGITMGLSKLKPAAP